MDTYRSELEKERAMKDQFMARHPESPFVVGEVAPFGGLRYFPIDPSYRIDAVLERREKPEEAALRTNRDGQLVCRYVGDMKFLLDGESCSLRVYHAGEQVGPSVFIPFRDGTCGSESYASGRYLTLQLTEDDRYSLDFNLAFNMYCAYTDRFECGFPPAENDLALPIRAGEMAWESEAEPLTATSPEPPTAKLHPERSRPKSRAAAGRHAPPRAVQKTRKDPKPVARRPSSRAVSPRRRRTSKSSSRAAR